MEYVVQYCQICKNHSLHGVVRKENVRVCICCVCAVKRAHEQEQVKGVLIPGPFGGPRPLKEYAGCLE